MIRRAQPDDLDAIAELLGLAFADDPWTRWCVDAEGHVDRITALHRISLEALGLPFGMVWVSEAPTRLMSAAVWSDSSTETEPALLTELGDRSRPFHGDRLAHAMAAEQDGHARPTAEHLFLETMGTDPAHQRAGHGSSVLRPGLDLADQRAVMCALETSTEANVAFYRTVGFDVVDHRVVADGGPDVWTLWRIPVQASRRR